MNNKLSIQIAMKGLVVQLILLLFVYSIGFLFRENQIIETLTTILSAILLFIPIVGLYGVYIGITQIKEFGFSTPPVLGLTLNTCWIFIFSFFGYQIFFDGVTV